MPKYTVDVAEVNYRFYEVEANSKEQAIEFIKNNNDDKAVYLEQTEYGYDLPSDKWFIEEKI